MENENLQPQNGTIDSPNNEPEATKPFKTFETEEDYNRAFKSEVSKAKNEWLKSTGVSSVEEFKNKESQYNSAIEENSKLQKDLETARAELTKANEKNIVLELGVDKDYEDDALTLARAKVTNDIDLKTALSDVLKKNPTWTTKSDVKIGVEKSDVKGTPEISGLAKKYDWLR